MRVCMPAKMAAVCSGETISSSVLCHISARGWKHALRVGMSAASMALKNIVARVWRASWDMGVWAGDLDLPLMAMRLD